MHLVFEQDEKGKRIRGIFRLDEAMGNVNRFRNVRTVTAELVVEYLKPVPVDEELVVEAHEVEKQGRNLHHYGEVRDRAGQVLARGHGRFVEVGLSKLNTGRKTGAKK
jgi:acyl-coenzyme A thioesterase PaaI-like protein